MNYVLPGVFKDHPTEIVNNTLWTVPHEIGCYIIMSGLILFALLRKPWLLPIMAGVIIVIGLVLAQQGYDENSTGFDRVLYMLFVSKASRLNVSFLLGIFAFLIRDKLTYFKTLFWSCAIGCVAIGAIPQPDGVNYPLMSILLAPLMTLMTAFIGVTKYLDPQRFSPG